METVTKDTCQERMNHMKENAEWLEGEGKRRDGEIKEITHKVSSLEQVVALSAQSMNAFVEATERRFQRNEEEAKAYREDFQSMMKQFLDYLKCSPAGGAKKGFPWEELIKSKVAFVLILFACASIFLVIVSAVAHDYLAEAFKVMGGIAK